MVNWIETIAIKDARVGDSLVCKSDEKFDTLVSLFGVRLPRGVVLDRGWTERERERERGIMYCCWIT